MTAELEHIPDTLGRTPPNDQDAEKAVLGSCLQSATALHNTLPILTATDFYQPRHETIWHSITRLHNAGDPVDAITVAADLTRTGDIQRIGGPLYLYELTATVTIPGNATYYAEIVQDSATRRRLIDTATRIQQLAYQSTDPTNTLTQTARDWLDQTNTLNNGQTTLEKYPTLNLTDLLNPDRPPREWAIAGLLPARASTALVAPAGTAKSLFSLGLAIHLSQGRRHFAGFDIPQARTVLYIDMENTPDDLAERFEDYGLTATDTLTNLHYLSLPRLPALDTPEGGHELRNILDAYHLTPGDLVILDSLQRVTEGEENKSDTMRAFYLHAGIELKRRGLTVLRLDNTGKDTTKGSRGTSSKKDDVDVELVMIRDADDKHKFHIEVTKGRMGDYANKFTITRDPNAPTITWSTGNDPQRAAIQECKRFLDDHQFPTTGRGAGGDPAFKFTQAQGRKFVRETVRMAQAERRSADHVFDNGPPKATADFPQTNPAEPTRRTTADFPTTNTETASDKAQHISETPPTINGGPRRGPTGVTPPSAPAPLGAAELPEGDQKSKQTRTRCTVCRGPMTDLGDGQTTHPNCTP